MSESLTLTVAEAAKVLGLGRTTVWRMIQAGELPGVMRFRETIRIDRRRFYEWYDRRAAQEPLTNP